jgi:membrane-bound lytic murein transglycosylase A
MYRILLLLALALFNAACTTAPTIKPALTKPVTAHYDAVDWTALPDWPGEELPASWSAWLASCTKLGKDATWFSICADAQAVPATDTAAIRSFFETHFTPLRISSSLGTDEGMITGYYEAQLKGGLEQKPGRVPIYGVPADMLTIDESALYPQLKGMRLRGRLQGNTVQPYWSRHDIATGKLPPDTPVLAWADDPIDAFFLEIQGSGRVDLDNGQRLRLAYADQNGHPYKSIGQWLVEHKEMTVDQASMQNIRAWAQTHPERLRELLDANPSVVFFRVVPDDGSGAIGALNVPLTGGSSIAVDPKFVPLGSPVYLSTTRPKSTQTLRRLVQAQDTGGAIHGPVRADFFWGFGKEAGELAGRMKQQGQVWVLWPKGKALPVN